MTPAVYHGHFEWTQIGDDDWYTTAHGFAGLVTYDEEFDAFEWVIRVEQTQKVFASGMSRNDDEARHCVEREIRMYRARKDAA